MDTEQFLTALDISIHNIEQGMVENEDWFHNLYDNEHATMDDYFELAKQINPSITRKRFDIGWQFRMVRHENYNYAKTEFLNLLLGWY